jgi:hypothetical protein
MPLSADCPCGRSQNVMIPRESLVKTRVQVGQSFDILENARHSEIMLRMLRTYLESQDTNEAHRANLLLCYYLDVMPEALEEVQDLLSQAHTTIKSFCGGGVDD